MQVVVVAGGIGGARFLQGLRAAVPEADLTAIVNTGDDVTLHGLRICPDLDSVMYTLGDGADDERGWGRRAESWRIKDELARYGSEPAWFGLGDLDIATHLVRTRMLDAADSLTAVTAAVVGVILNLAIWFGLHVFFAGKKTDWLALAICGLAVLGLLKWRWSVIPVILGSGLFGLLVRLIG